MSTSINNFFAEMAEAAKAMEQLPVVQAELITARSDINGYLATIQRLELKLIERANEIDNLNAAVRKLEVERDHAERMFLETDDRLNAFRKLVQHFQAEVETYDAAMPPKEVPAEPNMKQVGEDVAFNYPNAPAEPFRSEYRPTPDPFDQADKPAVSSEDHIDGPFPYGKGESAVDPTMTQTQPSSGNTIPEAEAGPALSSDEGVSVSDYPTSATSPSAGSGSDAGSAPVTADATSETVPTTGGTATSIDTSVDDVGYHNEPKIGKTGDVHADWADWERWQYRMDARYGVGRWPQRPDTGQSSQASQYSF